MMQVSCRVSQSQSECSRYYSRFGLVFCNEDRRPVFGGRAKMRLAIQEILIIDEAGHSGDINHI